MLLSSSSWLGAEHVLHPLPDTCCIAAGRSGVRLPPCCQPRSGPAFSGRSSLRSGEPPLGWPCAQCREAAAGAMASKKAPPSASPKDPVAPATELDEAEQLAEALRRSLNLRAAG